MVFVAALFKVKGITAELIVLGIRGVRNELPEQKSVKTNMKIT
jgi:hypothetical protein